MTEGQSYVMMFTGVAMVACVSVAFGPNCDLRERRDDEERTEETDDDPGAIKEDLPAIRDPRLLLDKRNRCIHTRVSDCESKNNGFLDCNWWVFGGEPPHDFPADKIEDARCP